MPNKEFKVQVFRVGSTDSAVLSISAASAEAAKGVAEVTGWTVQGVTEVGAEPQSDATLNSLRDELRVLQQRVQAL